MSDNDWFERALRELEEEADSDTESAEEEADSGSDTERDTDTEPEFPPETLDFEGFEAEFSGGRPPTDEETESGGLFDDDFSTAFDRVGVGMDVGAGGGVVGPEDEFDEPIESDLPRLELGIDGLDEMIQGGIPKRSLISVIGGAGTGKTTFAMQFLNSGLEAGERGVFISLEQSKEAVLDTATELGWSFEEYVDAGDLVIVEFDPVGMANSLASIRGDLPRLIGDFGADRFVLDSVSLLEMMYEDQSKRRNEIYDFTWSLKESGVTPLLTSEASEQSEFASRYGIVEYLTDAVFVLRNIRATEYQESRLGVEIMKIRNTRHSRETKPFEIGTGGLEVYRQATIF